MIRLNRTKVVGKKSYYFFRCDCGNIIERRSDFKSNSCFKTGCTKSSLRRHGESHTRLYKIWDGIKGRALHGNHASCVTYSQRGITICDEWLEFSVFKDWALSNGYTDCLTIDRKNINGNYEPSNCRWLTRSENTKAQAADGHTYRKSIKLNEVTFSSISSAARHISKFTSTKFKSICAALEKRVNTNSLKPYYGFTVSVDKEGK